MEEIDGDREGNRKVILLMKIDGDSLYNTDILMLEVAIGVGEKILTCDSNQKI